MKERPIPFKPEMVIAILNGTKTQTRRVMEPQPHAGVRQSVFVQSGWEDGHGYELKCRYGQVGDRLWVRETWLYVGPGSGSELPYAVDQTKDPANHIRENVWYRATRPDGSLRWKPSIFMPRWASRILLEITEVRVERVQDISSDDAEAEGVEWKPNPHGIWQWQGKNGRWHDYPQDAYRDLWDTINEARGHSWQSNPWVWVLAFRRVE